MEGYKGKWRGYIEEDWTEWIGSKTLDFLVDCILCAIWSDHPGVYILYMNTMCTWVTG